MKRTANLGACFLAAIGLLFAGLVAACSKSEPPEASATDELGAMLVPAGKADQAAKAKAKVDVKLQLNWVPEPEFGGFYAAAHKGLYEQSGLNVDIAAGAAGIQTWKMVATGKVPFAIASAGEVIRARLQDADIVAVYAVYQTNPQAFMVHEQSGITSLEEIFSSGKIARVAMEAGLPYGRHLKEKYGFDKVDVVQYSGNLSLFLQDPKMAQQCFIFSEPVSAQEKGVPVKTFSIGESGFNPYLAVVITSEAFLAKQPDVVARFVRASRAGWQAYLDDPEPTNQYMKDQKADMSLAAMKIAAALQAPYIINKELRADPLGNMSAVRWIILAEQLHALGEIDRVPEVEDLFRNFE